MVMTTQLRLLIALIRFVTYFVDLAVALIGIATLGFWVPDWEMSFRIWTSKKIIRKRIRT